MTVDDLAALDKAVTRGKELLGKITYCKERIAWLQGDTSLEVRFVVADASTRQDCALSPLEMTQVREIVLRSYRERLVEAEVALNSLTGS